MPSISLISPMETKCRSRYCCPRSGSVVRRSYVELRAPQLRAKWIRGRLARLAGREDLSNPAVDQGVAGSVVQPARVMRPCSNRPRHPSVIGRPARAGTSRDETNGIALAVDPLRLGIDPPVAERGLLHGSEGHGLPAGCLLVDGDDDLSLAAGMRPQPTIEVGVTGHGYGLEDFQAAHVPPLSVAA